MPTTTLGASQRRWWQARYSGTLTHDEHGPWGDRHEEFGVALELADQSNLGDHDRLGRLPTRRRANASSP